MIPLSIFRRMITILLLSMTSKFSSVGINLFLLFVIYLDLLILKSSSGLIADIKLVLFSSQNNFVERLNATKFIVFISTYTPFQESLSAWGINNYTLNSIRIVVIKHKFQILVMLGRELKLVLI